MTSSVAINRKKWVLPFEMLALDAHAHMHAHTHAGISGKQAWRQQVKMIIEYERGHPKRLFLKSVRLVVDHAVIWILLHYD